MSPAGAQDDNLTDDDLKSEIEMVSELVVAATSSDRHQDQDEVDRVFAEEIPKPADYKPRSDSAQAFAPRSPTIGGVSIFKPQGLGGFLPICAYWKFGALS